jgi:putative ABC transport system substrate-binding protein
MTRRTALTLALTLGLLTAGRSGEAQAPTRLWRIGFLAGASRETTTLYLATFIQALRDLGYVDGRNITIDTRYADGRPDRLPGLAAELIALKPDLMVTSSTPAAVAAKETTRTIPIVMTTVGEPVQVKLVESLARPGGNVTGLSLIAPELAAKRLDLLKQALPKLSRVTVLWNSSNAGMQARFSETQAAATALGIRLQSVSVHGPDDFEPVFTALAHDRPDALFVLADPVTTNNRQRAIEFAARYRVPAIYELRQFVESGGLMSYGVDMPDHYRRAAVYVDKILKGARPADLPVEQPTKFELLINSRTASALGVTIPEALLIRADEVLR